MNIGIIKEVKRKFIHFLALFFIVIYVLLSKYYTEKIALLGLLLLLVVFLIIDYIRVEMNKKIPIIWNIFREKEKDKFAGNVFFLIGAIIVFSLLDFRIALTALLMTIFGDMAAALIGKSLGKTWITKNRALEGIVAELIIDVIIGCIVLDSWIIILVMALAATIVETSVNKLDDNLFIPVFSGFFGEIARYILEWGII
ncbi:CTP--2,3-di-O-geranylgeranyl-sn-glycero-1-phosphate cytidyltransferase [Candidatus Pacearchaeota archaeon]|nr:CTP--2,3-di-O-geranylgeranyl-sn-glycero-1-phosphate cytidyltransferase [Candidatus Pacearchaeota archaeon]